MWSPIWFMISKSGKYTTMCVIANSMWTFTSDLIFFHSKIEGSYVITTHAVELFKEIISKTEWRTAQWVYKNPKWLSIFLWNAQFY